MRNFRHPLIAREGWSILFVVGVAAAASTYFLHWLSIPLWVVFFFSLQFFRDPPRTPPEGEGLVCAPADGRVIVVGESVNPMSGDRNLKISIFMNVFNVHSNRLPVSGKIVERRYSAGRFFNAALDKASDRNEQNALVIESDGGQKVTCIQIAGLIARRILCYISEGERGRKGERFGFIRFGSRVDVYLPLGSKPIAAVGDKVVGGQSIVAELEIN
jgi:phosphatidylserine decarboxylase